MKIQVCIDTGDETYLSSVNELSEEEVADLEDFLEKDDLNMFKMTLLDKRGTSIFRKDVLNKSVITIIKVEED